jgi:glycosyltransferase involved in cell wall biosynthesis
VVFNVFWKVPKPFPGRKRIVIDARVVVSSHGHGIARYTEELLCELCQTLLLENPDSDSQGQGLEFLLLVSKNSPILHWKLPMQVRTVVMVTGWIAFAGQLELGILLLFLKADIFHSPSFIVPFLSRVPLITTIHDLNHVVLAENYSLFHRMYYSFFLANKINKACSVITVSKFSCDEIVKFFKVERSRVKVIYNGISRSFRGRATQRNSAELATFRRRYELPLEFVLSAGNRKPHKNMRRLVEAWCLLKQNIPLVLLMEFDPELSQIAQSHKKKHLIYFLRFVPAEELHNVYSLARVFVFPSLYEGFGFPPLEAAACGVPVVASNKTSLPEVLNKSALLFDPESIDDIRKRIEEALVAPEQSARLNEEGLEVLKRFEWSVALKETLLLYRGVLS